MKRKGRTRLSSGVWAEALEKDDKMAVELIEDAVEALGIALASVQNLLALEAIVVEAGWATVSGSRSSSASRRR